MSTLNGMPWQEYADVQLYVNEYVQPSSLNRGFHRLLENDRYLYDMITTPVDTAGETFIETSKNIKILGSDGDTYYVRLYKKI
jgi:hypothetical protein